MAGHARFRALGTLGALAAPSSRCCSHGDAWGRRALIMYVLRKRRYKREVVGGGDSPMRDLLSPREKQLLKRLAAGKTDAQIAERLGGTAKQV